MTNIKDTSVQSPSHNAYYGIIDLQDSEIKGILLPTPTHTTHTSKH
jgi:hypothetical protein